MPRLRYGWSEEKVLGFLQQYVCPEEAFGPELPTLVTGLNELLAAPFCEPDPWYGFLIEDRAWALMQGARLRQLESLPDKGRDLDWERSSDIWERLGKMSRILGRSWEAGQDRLCRHNPCADCWRSDLVAPSDLA